MRAMTSVLTSTFCVQGAGSGSAARMRVEQQHVAFEIEDERRRVVEGAVDDDEVAGLDFGVDGFSQDRGGEDRRKSIEREVRRDQDRNDHAGEEAVGHAGVVAQAEPQAGGDADDQGDEGDPERAAEGAHGGAGEVEKVSEEDGVMSGVGVEERRDVSAGGRGRARR